MIFQQVISLTCRPRKTQDTKVGLLPLVRSFYEERRRTHRSDSVRAVSLIFGGEAASTVPESSETYIDMTVVVESPNEFFFDQFMKSFLAKDRDMPFVLVNHNYEGS